MYQYILGDMYGKFIWVILVYICIIQVTASLTGLRPIYHYESGQIHIKLTY